MSMTNDRIKLEIHNHPESVNGLFKGSVRCKSEAGPVTPTSLWQGFCSADPALNAGLILDRWVAFRDAEGPDQRKLEAVNGVEPVLQAGDLVGLYVRKAD